MLDSERGIKIGVFDIETSDLDAYYGYMFCGCVGDIHQKKITTFRIDDKRNPERPFGDKWLVRMFIEELNKFDMLVGWYSSGFDFLFLNTRASMHKLEVPAKNYRRDLCYIARGNFKLPNNKLKTACQVILGKTNKTFTTPEIKLDAIRGEKKALDFIVDHCERDIIDTKEIYYRMMPLLSKKIRKQ